MHVRNEHIAYIVIFYFLEFWVSVCADGQQDRGSKYKSVRYNKTVRYATTDFEIGMRNAIQFVYPDVQLQGCWLHYCQNT
jgi:transposase-like protein